MIIDYKREDKTVVLQLSKSLYYRERRIINVKKNKCNENKGKASIWV